MPKRVCLLVPLALFSLAACGDDADSASPGSSAGQGGSTTTAGAGAGAGTGGRSSTAGSGTSGSGGASGLGGPGGDEEGSPCMVPSDCDTGLRCAAVPGLLLNGAPIGVCGVPCSMDAECGDGAVCNSYSDMDRDKHCVNVIEEDYAACGVAETSVCPMGKACLVFPDTPIIGVCVTLCEAGAGDDDAGVPSGEPGGAGCAAGQTCIGGVLSRAAPNEGVCGNQVARGAECGIDIGVGDYCAPGDVCAPDDLDNVNSAVHCYQECSRAAPQCDTGACVLIPNAFGYCI